MATKITPRQENYSRWYTDVIAAAQLADYSPVKGCMVIRPTGYAIWENMRVALDAMFKETGHENLYFPLFIPESFMKKEAEHVKGFAPECAVVTHGGGKQLEEPLYIRPTSETIIWYMYSKWIDSYRDLPLLYNQWANVVRWEMRTRLFLRTTEFLWQEGHTAHATARDCLEETMKMLEVYRKFAEEYLAVPVIRGRKTEKEKFAGAVETYCIEGMMQDKRALQMGTSHNLGQNFAKAFNVTFQNEKGERDYVWATSWGVSTRLIGAVIMAHGDDRGLIIPPRIAPLKVVGVPIYKSTEEKEQVNNRLKELFARLPQSISNKVDDREQYTPGWKFNEWEVRGVPIRIELGPRDLKSDQVVVVRRDTGKKTVLPQDAFVDTIPKLLDEIQDNLFQRAIETRNNSSFPVDTYEDFKAKIEEPTGFLYCHWCGQTECEERIQDETKATIRCIPFDAVTEQGSCVYCGKPSTRRVLFAKAY